MRKRLHLVIALLALLVGVALWMVSRERDERYGGRDAAAAPDALQPETGTEAPANAGSHTGRPRTAADLVTLAGRIVEADGAPARAAEVAVYGVTPSVGPSVSCDGSRALVLAEAADLAFCPRAIDELMSMALAGELEDAPAAVTTTDADGAFAIRVEQGRYHLLARGATAGQALVEEIVAPSREIEIVLEHQGVQGRVLGPRQRPLADADVLLMVAEPRSALERVTSDADGWFLAPSLPRASEYWVWVRSPTLTPLLVRKPFAALDLIQLSPLWRIRGRVIEGEQPAAGAVVSLVDAVAAPVIADGNGEFAFREVSACSTHVMARRGAAAGSELAHCAASSPITIELLPAGAVSLAVVDAESGQPLLAAEPDSFDTAPSAGFEAQGGGIFIADPVFAGARTFQVSAEGYAPASADAQVEPGRETSLVVALPRTVSLAAVVIERGGHPLTGVEVEACRLAAPLARAFNPGDVGGLLGPFAGSGPCARATTDGHGATTLHGLTPGWSVVGVEELEIPEGLAENSEPGAWIPKVGVMRWRNVVELPRTEGATIVVDPQRVPVKVETRDSRGRTPLMSLEVNHGDGYHVEIATSSEMRLELQPGVYLLSFTTRNGTRAEVVAGVGQSPVSLIIELP